MSGQREKLSEITWHQSRAFNMHMKNIAPLQYVLKAEKHIILERNI